MYPVIDKTTDVYVKENYLKICGKISERMHNFHTHSFEYFGG